MKRSERICLLKRVLVLVTCISPALLSAQGLLNNGAKIVITNGPTVYVNGATGNYTSQSGGQFKNTTSNGAIILGGNWINNSSNTGFTADGTTVYLSGSSAQAISGSNASAFYNLSFGGGNTKTISSNSTVKNLVSVSSSTTLNANGKLTLLTIDTTSNANIGPLLSGASVTGNVNVQQFYTGGASSYRGNRLISTPLNDAALGTNNTYKQLQGYMIITGPGNTANGFDAGNSVATNAATIYRYNESVARGTSQFINAASIFENLAPANGTMIYYRGDRSNSSGKLNAPFATPESQTITLTGPVNQGNYTLNLSYTNNPGETDINGYNMAGNPYPCVIDWTAVTKDLGLVQDFIMFIKPKGGYATYLNGFSTNANGKDLRYIQPGQGFYVRAIAQGAYLTFTENCKVTSSSPARFMFSNKESLSFAGQAFSSAPARVKSSSQKVLRINLQDGTNTEETVAVFENGRNTVATTEDAALFGGSTVAMGTLSSDNKRLTINFMPELDAVPELKLYVEAASTKTVTVSFPEIQGMEAYQLLLKDNYTNQLIDLKSQPFYTFSINRADAASFGDNRLKVLFQPVTTLPVKLVSFKAKKADKGTLLSWQLATQAQTDRFEIERSEDGSAFQSIGQVKEASSTSSALNYSFIDEKPVAGINYYRLKQFGSDGKFAYSPVESVDYTLAGINLTLSPNPATDKITIKLPSAYNSVNLTITDLAGIEVRSKKFTKNQSLELAVADLMQGVYIVKITDASNDEKIGTVKFIKR